MSGKKYVVLSQEEYQRLKENHQQALIHPEKNNLQKSETEMKNVLDSGLPSDEKIRLFTEELNNLKTRYDDLRKPRPFEVISKMDKEATKNVSVKDEKDNIERAVLHSISKGSKKEAELLVDHLKAHPNVIRWNGIGEMMFRGRVIPGSNIIDMIIDTVTNRKNSKISVMDKSIFVKALAESNVPAEWIKNKEQFEMLKSYRDIKPSNVAKKIKLDWESST